MRMDAATIWMVAWFTFLITVTALLLAPPAFVAGLFDGGHKRGKKPDDASADD